MVKTKYPNQPHITTENLLTIKEILEDSSTYLVGTVFEAVLTDQGDEQIGTPAPDQLYLIVTSISYKVEDRVLMSPDLSLGYDAHDANMDYTEPFLRRIKADVTVTVAVK